MGDNYNNLEISVTVIFNKITFKNMLKNALNGYISAF